MAFYLVERYVPSMPAADIEAAIARIDAAHADGPRVQVRHVWTILVRAEDTCLSVFEASDLEAVVQATARAGLPFDRVVEVTPVAGIPVTQVQGPTPETRSTRTRTT